MTISSNWVEIPSSPCKSSPEPPLLACRSRHAISSSIQPSPNSPPSREQRPRRKLSKNQSSARFPLHPFSTGSSHSICPILITGIRSCCCVCHTPLSQHLYSKPYRACSPDTTSYACVPNRNQPAGL